MKDIETILSDILTVMNENIAIIESETDDERIQLHNSMHRCIDNGLGQFFESKEWVEYECMRNAK